MSARLLFDWDSRKAEINLSKHGVAFEEALTIFQDPDALTIFDPDHSDDQDRWVTIGAANDLRLLLVIHTHVEIGEYEILIRMISARRPTRKETDQYRKRLVQ